MGIGCSLTEGSRIEVGAALFPDGAPTRKQPQFPARRALERGLNRRQPFSRMISIGFTINARRTGRTLASVTTPAKAIGAANHTQRAGEPLPRATPPIHRDKASDASIPASVPALASRIPSAKT